jgi:hypothetical protein
VPATRRASRDAALVELQRLHAAILASREKRGVGLTAGSPRPIPSPESVATRELTRRLQSERDVPAGHVPAAAARWPRGWWLALGAAVVVAGVWAAVTLTQRRDLATESGRGTPASAPPRDASPAAAPAAQTAVAAPVAATPAKAIGVALETIRPVWIRIIADGVRGFEGEVPAGEKLAAEGDREVRVRAGDAGGVRATTNGVDRGPLGRDGWPLTVSITPDGIRPLTPTRPEP